MRYINAANIYIYIYANHKYLLRFLIFFAIWYVISIDELKTDYKNPIETCNNLNPLVLPEYFVHAVPSVLFIFAGRTDNG